MNYEKAWKELNNRLKNSKQSMEMLIMHDTNGLISKTLVQKIEGLEFAICCMSDIKNKED